MGQVINVDIGTWRTMLQYRESIYSYPVTDKYADAIRKEIAIYQEMLEEVVNQ